MFLVVMPQKRVMEMAEIVKFIQFRKDVMWGLFLYNFLKL